MGINMNSTSLATEHTNVRMSVVYRPFDVLCGRDKDSFNNVGNRRFRIMINLNLEKYLNCKSRLDRSEMILSLTKELLGPRGNFRFLKRNGERGGIVVLDFKQSREKIGHALRDAAALHRKSKTRDIAITKDIQSRLSSHTIRTTNSSPHQLVDPKIVYDTTTDDLHSVNSDIFGEADLNKGVDESSDLSNATAMMPAPLPTRLGKTLPGETRKSQCDPRIFFKCLFEEDILGGTTPTQTNPDAVLSRAGTCNQLKNLFVDVDRYWFGDTEGR